MMLGIPYQANARVKRPGGGQRRVFTCGGNRETGQKMTTRKAKEARSACKGKKVSPPSGPQ